MTGQGPDNRDLPDPGDRDGTETADQLMPGMTGRWLVTTQRTRHVWDLNRHTYERRPGSGAQPMPYDRRPVPTGRIGRWPRVGDSAVIFYDDPDHPGWEQYRVSSTIASIDRLDTAEPGSSNEP